MLRISPNSSDEVTSTNSVQQIQPVQNGRSSITFFIEHITFNFTPYFEQNSREINSACFFPWFRTLQEPITTKDKQVWNPQLTNWCENFEISIFISKLLHICICILSGVQLNSKEAHPRFLVYQVPSLPLSVQTFSSL